MKILAIGLTAFVLVAVVAPHSRAAAPARVSAHGFALTSLTVELPFDETQYPDGPGADVINANCTACHSASMALTRDQWSAIVSKMADTYKAPIDRHDMPAIVAYLTAMSARLPGAKGPAPRTSNEATTG